MPLLSTAELLLNEASAQRYDDAILHNIFAGYSRSDMLLHVGHITAVALAVAARRSELCWPGPHTHLQVTVRSQGRWMVYGHGYLFIKRLWRTVVVRYDSIDCFISTSPLMHDKYNDVPLVYDAEALATLVANGPSFVGCGQCAVGDLIMGLP